MKKSFYLIVQLIILWGATDLLIGGAVAIDHSAGKQVYSSDYWDPGRPDSHAPIGVLADHTHGAGEFMLSYRYMFMSMDGQRAGTNRINSQEVFARGFAVAPTSMQTHMHMLGAMYAPTDWLTLMAMGSYAEKAMDHVTAADSMARALRGRTFTNRVDGWGDVSISGLFKVYDDNRQRIHLGMGLSIPVGEENELAYPMQFSSGTWDLLPSATWLWQGDQLSGGVQVSGRIHLGENDFGYAYGDRVRGTTWLAFKLADWVSLAGRFSAEYLAEIDGVDRRIMRIMAPPMDAANSGGTFVEAGIGVNFLLADGFLAGNRLAVEALFPIYQDVNGLQLEREWMLIAGWQFAF